jgi:site-specific recombinase XerD
MTNETTKETTKDAAATAAAEIPKAERPTKGVYETAPGSKVFGLEYYDENRRRHREQIGRKSAAIEMYSTRKREIREGRFIAPTRKRLKIPTFEELLELSLAWAVGRRSEWTIKGNKNSVKAFLAAFGKRPVTEIKQADVTAVLSELVARGLSGNTANQYMLACSTAFRHAVKVLGVLAKNPCSGIEKYKPLAGETWNRVRYLDDGDAKVEGPEELAIRLAIRRDSPEKEDLMTVALQTGMRRSEMHFLKWTTVSLGRGVLDVLQGKTGRRTIPINETCRAALERLYRDSLGSPWVTRAAETHGKRNNTTWFEEAVKELLGHTLIQTTMIYAHLAPKHLADVVGVLDGERAGGTATRTANRPVVAIRKR